jgi:hypothetical protein
MEGVQSLDFMGLFTQVLATIPITLSKEVETFGGIGMDF